MKNRTLPVKRRPAPKGLLKRLSAVTRRKQRVSATAAEPDMEDSSSRISRALTIIFMIHIVAIGLIFFHQNFLDGRTVEGDGSVAENEDPVLVMPTPAVREDAPRLSSGDTPYIVKAGDNYARIAAAHGVEESELRFANKHAEIGPGLILIIPPKRIVAVDPPEVAALRGATVRDRNDGLVVAVPVDVSNAPRARLVRPSATPGSAGADSYVVQAGDTLWKISNRFNISADALQKANDITDPRKMKIGMKLKIPR